MHATMKRKFTKQILVHPLDLNHSGTLFGARMMAWADEMAYIAATLTYPHCTFVTKVFNEFNFISGATDGTIIEIEAELLRTGTTSVTVGVKAKNTLTGQEIFKTSAIMVNARDGKAFPINPTEPKSGS